MLFFPFSIYFKTLSIPFPSWNGTMAVCLANLIGVDEKENCMDNYTPPDAKELPEGFAPSEFDVLCGWARQNFHHGKLNTSLLSQLIMQVMRQSLLTFMSQSFSS